MMNSIEVENLLLSNVYSSMDFHGVYPRDRLPRTVDYPSSYVPHSDTSKRPGEHWVAVYFDSLRRGSCFDSCGIPPFHKQFIKFMNNHLETWTFNDMVLQAPFSSVCGQYCVYFLLYKSRGFTAFEIVSRFSNNLFENDRSVSQFVLNL